MNKKAASKNKPCVLVIEDDRFMRELIGIYLEESGYQVEYAEDGTQGVRKAKSAKPDAIILDLMIPGMNGVQVYSALKKDKGTKNTPIVIASAMNNANNLLHDAMGQLGVSQFVNKPYTKQDLLRALKIALK